MRYLIISLLLLTGCVSDLPTEDDPTEETAVVGGGVDPSYVDKSQGQELEQEFDRMPAAKTPIKKKVRKNGKTHNKET